MIQWLKPMLRVLALGGKERGRMMRNRVIQALQRKGVSLDTIFDVGANVGQSLQEFRSAFPRSRIYAFEPVAASFAVLREAVAQDPNSTVYHLGLSRSSGSLMMTSKGTSTGNRIVSRSAGEGLEVVQIECGDAFCAEHDISKIDFLKIDTEGHDLDVLVGFRNMLAEGSIKFVQVECGLAPSNMNHVRYEAMASFMFALGYGLFGLFGVTPLRGTTNLAAHYGDAVFVRDGT